MVMQHMVKRLVIGLYVLCLPLFAGAQATLSAGVDRTLVEQGDIIQFTLMANFQTTSQPDFEPLKADFEVLGVQASSQLRVINGQFTGTTQWDAQLIAKRSGSLTLPAFEIDHIRSQPLKIEVSPPSEIQTDYKISFLEAQVDQLNPYVQSQVIFTLRYYHLGTMVRGQIEPPQFPNMLHERIRNQHTFERRVKGRVYRVYEWVYALHPQTSGEIVIPPQTFEGTLLNDRQLRLVSEQTTPIKLQVKPIPSSYPPNEPWLPAKQLTFTEQWTQQTTELKVGDTLGRRLTIQASGLKSSQIPDADWTQNSAYKLYADPVTQNDHLNEQGLTSVKTQDFVLVAQQAGKLQIEPLKIVWWNTQTDQLEYAQISGREFDIAATNHHHDSDFIGLESAQHQHNNQSTSLFWQLTTAAFALLWLITLTWHWRRNKTRVQTATGGATNPTELNNSENSRPLNDSISSICQLPDAKLYQAVKHWLKQHHAIDDWRKLNHPKLLALLQQLEASLYQTDREVAPLNRDALQHELNALVTQQQQQTSPLKALYPH